MASIKHSYTPHLIFLAYTTLSILFKAETSFYADDNFRWALSVLSYDGSIINSHHLIYDVLATIYHKLHIISIIEPDKFLSYYSAIMGGLGLVWLYRIAIHLNLKRFAIVSVVSCSMTSGYLAYSAVGDVYVPTIACALGGIWYLIRTMQSESAVARGLFAVVSGSLFFLAILHHQAFFVLITSLGLYVLIISLKQKNKKLSFISGISCIALAGMLSLTTYIGIYNSLDEKNGFYNFMAGYAESFASYPDMKQINTSTLINSSAGFSRALVSANAIFAYDSVAKAVSERFPYRHIHSSVYVAQKTPKLLFYVGGISLAIFLLIAIPVSIYGLCLIYKNTGLLFILLSISPQLLFFMWWESISDEFWIWTLPFWSLIISHGFKSIGENRLLFPTIMYTTLGISTLTLSSIPYSQEEYSIDWQNHQFVKNLSSNDVLISLDEIVMANKIGLYKRKQGFEYYNFFTRAEKGKTVDFDFLLDIVDQSIANNKNVYIGPYISNPPASYLRLIEKNNKVFASQFNSFKQALRERSPILWQKNEEEMKGYF